MDAPTSAAMPRSDAAPSPGVAAALTAPGALADRVHALYSYATTSNLSYVLAAVMFVVLFKGDVPDAVLGGWAVVFVLVIAGRAWTAWSYQRVAPSDDAASLVWLRAWNVGTLASGAMSNLVHRAASVALKERRKLVLVPRETPLSSIHLRGLATLNDAGAVILFAAPGFYHAPETIDDLVDFLVARCLDQIGIDNALAKRWGDA